MQVSSSLGCTAATCAPAAASGYPAAPNSGSAYPAPSSGAAYPAKASYGAASGYASDGAGMSKLLSYNSCYHSRGI